MRNTPCECASAGWCERHQCLKSEVLFHRCRRDQAMFRAWEDGRGPCLPPPDIIPETSADGPEDTVMPGLRRRIANFGAAATRHVMSGFRKVSDAACAERLAICTACPSCDTGPMICKETTCGCYLLIKATWASEACPKGAWPTLKTEASPSSKDDESS